MRSYERNSDLVSAQAGKWTLDLKNEGKLCKGEAGKADCTITMKDADFLVTFLKVSYCKATVQFRRWLLLAAPVFQHTHWLDSHGCSSASTNRSEQAMVAGKLNGQQAFMQGKLKLKGNMMLAQKLGTALASLKSSRKIHGWHIVCQKDEG